MFFFYFKVKMLSTDYVNHACSLSTGAACWSRADATLLQIPRLHIHKTEDCGSTKLKTDVLNSTNNVKNWILRPKINNWTRSSRPNAASKGLVSPSRRKSVRISAAGFSFAAVSNSNINFHCIKIYYYILLVLLLTEKDRLASAGGKTDSGHKSAARGYVSPTQQRWCHLLFGSANVMPINLRRLS